MPRVVKDALDWGIVDQVQEIDFPVDTPAEERGNIYEVYIHPVRQRLIERFRSTVGLEIDKPELYTAESLREKLDDSTAWNRIKNIFKRDANDQISGEYLLIVQSSTAAAIVGAIIGGAKGVKGVRERFAKYHQATIFDRVLEAKSRMLDTVIYHGLRTSIKYGMKYGLFMFGFTSISTMVVATRQQSGIMEYAIAGLVSGSLYRLNMGLSGMATAGALGGVLGTICGSLIYGARQLTGRTYEETAYWVKMSHVNRYRAQLEAEQSRNNALLRFLGKTPQNEAPVLGASSPVMQDAKTATLTGPVQP